MKLKIVAPLHQNEYYVLDGGFSTQLSRFEVLSLGGGEEFEFSKHRVFLFSDMSREWTLTLCGPPVAWLTTRRR